MAARAGTDVVKAGYWFVGYDKIRLAPDIPSELFTHLYAGFAVVDSDTGGVTFPTKYQEQFQTFPTTVRKRNPTLKALLSIGGPGSDISPVVRDGAKLARFIKDSIHLAWTFGYDGLDLYWLFPSPFDNCDNLINLLNPWRGAVSQDAKNRNKLELLLTATVFHHPANPNISIFLDWINVLAIDFYTPSNSPKETGPVHAWLNPKEPNRCGSDGIRHWINSGVAANKLVFGLPFYGYEWKLIDPNVYGYFAPANPADYNYIDYKNIQKIVGKAKYQTGYNTDYVGTYSHNHVGSWIGYDDKNSISEKVKKAIPTYKLRRYFAWNLGGDDDKWTLTKADLNQEPLTHQSSIFSPEAVNTMIGAVNRFSSKADSEIIAGSRMLSNQYAASVTIISRRLMARVSEIDHLNMQISELRQKLANKDSENKRLKQENQELKKFADWYAHDLQPRIEELERERVQIQGQHRQITAEVHHLLEK